MEAFNGYVWHLGRFGVDTDRIQLIHGSKMYGNSFKLVRIDENGGHSSAPGAGWAGHIGWTKREAWNKLTAMTQMMSDLKWEEEKKSE